MASVPPCDPDRIDPQSPPGIEPPATEPSAPDTPEILPLAPDVDEPDRSPDEVPADPSAPENG